MHTLFRLSLDDKEFPESVESRKQLTQRHSVNGRQRVLNRITNFVYKNNKSGEKTGCSITTGTPWLFLNLTSCPHLER